MQPALAGTQGRGVIEVLREVLCEVFCRRRPVEVFRTALPDSEPEAIVGTVEVAGERRGEMVEEDAV